MHSTSIRFALFLLTVGTLPAAPATITLLNGKKYEQAEVVSQTAEAVTLRYSGGIAQVDKRMLPDDLRARYPLDEKAAEAERARQERDQVRAQARAERKEEHAALSRARSNPTPATTTTPATPSFEALEAGLTVEARSRANTYFRNRRYGSGSELTLVARLEIEPIEPIQGWSNRYRAKGVAYVQFYESSGGSFAKREQRFEIVLATDERGRVRTHEISEL